MSRYSEVKIEEETDNETPEVNHNTTQEEVGCDGLELLRANEQHIRNFTTEVIELPNDGRVEIVASRRSGRHVKSSRKKDEVTITLDRKDIIHIAIEANDPSSGPNVLRNCGAMIPHGPAVLDVMVSSIVLVYAFLLTVLVAHVRDSWKYLSIMMLWFFYVMLRINTYRREPNASPLGPRLWHFTGMSFGIMFMYATLAVVFPMLARHVFYGAPPTRPDVWNITSFIMPSLKASVGITLFGMAARRSFHCGKILSHMDVINSILLDNVDIFNLVESLGIKDGALPMISKGSFIEICILVVSELAFLVVAFEALMPYSLTVRDAKTVGRIRHDMSIQESKEHAIVMVYPYSLLIQNLPFLVIRLVLFARYNTLQLGYIVKNITSILFGSITLMRARNSIKGHQGKGGQEFLSRGFQQRRISV